MSQLTEVALFVDDTLRLGLKRPKAKAPVEGLLLDIGKVDVDNSGPGPQRLQRRQANSVGCVHGCCGHGLGTRS